MIPVSFEGCAGLLHPGRSDRGVVICGAIGHETSGTHRGLFELAELLSSAGHHVLRFDYPGTGDSAGSGTEPDRLERSVRSVELAVAFLRLHCDVQSVTLIGFRLGALLACLAAPRAGDVEQMVLLDPVISGRHYLRELRLLASAWDAANGQSNAAQAGLVVVGEQYGPDFIAALSSVDLRKSAPAPVRMLLVSEDRFGLAAFEQACHDEGSDVTRLPFPDLAAYLIEPVEAAIPRAAFASVVSWIGPAPRQATRAALPALPAVIELDRCRETALCFGPRDGLFGVLCAPSGAVRPEAVTVLFVNTGVTRHIGDGRLFVEAARALAAHGIASLRFDVAGIGESAADPDRVGLVYSPSAQTDVGCALDRLEREGHHRFAILGVCSGAHLALHAAREDPRITAAVMINLQKFIWSPDRSLTIQRKRARRPARYYFEAIATRQSWARLRRGDLAVGAICVSIMSRPLLHARRLAAMKAERWFGVATRFGLVRRWLVELADRGVDVRFWFGRDDQGVAEFATWFGAGGRDLRGIGRVRTKFVEHTDHAMQSVTSRATLIDLLLHEVESGLGRRGP